MTDTSSSAPRCPPNPQMYWGNCGSSYLLPLQLVFYISMYLIIFVCMYCVYNCMYIYIFNWVFHIYIYIHILDWSRLFFFPFVIKYIYIPVPYLYIIHIYICNEIQDRCPARSSWSFEVTRVWEDTPMDTWNREHPTRQVVYGSHVTSALERCRFQSDMVMFWWF